MAKHWKIGRLARRFSADERGGTAIEYALVAVGIACVVAAAIRLTGSNLDTHFWKKVEEGTRN